MKRNARIPGNERSASGAPHQRANRKGNSRPPEQRPADDFAGVVKEALQVIRAEAASIKECCHNGRKWDPGTKATHDRYVRIADDLEVISRKGSKMVTASSGISETLWAAFSRSCELRGLDPEKEIARVITKGVTADFRALSKTRTNLRAESLNEGARLEAEWRGPVCRG